jgi:hypothetical protein
MRFITFITDASTVRDILAHLGNPAGRANVRTWPILLKNSVFGCAQKIAGPQGLRSLLDVGGRRDFVLRATKIVLTEPAAIRGSNSRRRSRLARNCHGYIFEFFNRIGRERPDRRRSQFDPLRSVTLPKSGRSRFAATGRCNIHQQDENEPLAWPEPAYAFDTCIAW